MPHTWTTEDEQTLMEIIEQHEPRRERLKDAGYGADAWWSEVAALLLARGIDTTAGGASRRAYEMRTREAEMRAPGQVDRWESAIDRVEQWERDWYERIDDGVDELTVRVRRIEALMSALAREWGVELPDALALGALPASRR